MQDVLVRADDVSKKFCRDFRRSLWYGLQDVGGELLGKRRHQDELRRDEFWAVEGASFELKRGECLGIIGHNGAGKTTLLRMLNGLIKPDRGRIEVRGRVGALIAVGAGFNPLLTGRENIFVCASILGLSAREIRRKFDSIVEFAELSDAIDMPVQFYSSGMAVRLGFSIATSLKPDILILDEVLAVGDAAFKIKAYQRIASIAEDCAVLLVTHSISQLARMCDSVCVMSKGRMQRHASPTSAIATYLSGALGTQGREVLAAAAPGITFEFSHPKRLDPREHWVLDIEVQCIADQLVDSVIVNFTSQDGILVAEYRSFDNTYALQAGASRISISLEAPRLRSGQYVVDFALYSKGGKVPLVHVSRSGPVVAEDDSVTEALVLLNGHASISGIR